MSNWPKHPDGRNMKLGEMTADQRRAVWREAGKKLEAEFARPHVKAQLARVLNSDPPPPARTLNPNLREPTMCQCTPNKRTPFCGKPGCTWPVSGTNLPSPLDMLTEESNPIEADGSQIWYAVSNPNAVRGQPMALFQKASDAQMIGGRMTLSDVEIIPVRITVPPEVRRKDAPMPPITVITD